MQKEQELRLGSGMGKSMVMEGGVGNRNLACKRLDGASRSTVQAPGVRSLRGAAIAGNVFTQVENDGTGYISSG